MSITRTSLSLPHKVPPRRLGAVGVVVKIRVPECPYLPGDLEPLSSEESEALWELQELRRCERQAGDSLRDLRRGRPRAKGQAEPRRGTRRDTESPAPPASPAPHLLRSLFLSFRLFLGLRDLREEPKAADVGAGAASGGGFPSPQRHRGCGGSEGSDLPGLELGSIEVQSMVGISDGFRGTGAGW